MLEEVPMDLRLWVVVDDDGVACERNGPGSE